MAATNVHMLLTFINTRTKIGICWIRMLINMFVMKFTVFINQQVFIYLSIVQMMTYDREKSFEIPMRFGAQTKCEVHNGFISM